MALFVWIIQRASFCFLEPSLQWTISLYSSFACHLTLAALFRSLLRPFFADSFPCCLLFFVASFYCSTVSLWDIPNLLLWFLFYQIMSTHAYCIYTVIHTSLPPAACSDSYKTFKCPFVVSHPFRAISAFFLIAPNKCWQLFCHFILHPCATAVVAINIGIALRFFHYEYFFPSHKLLLLLLRPHPCGCHLPPPPILHIRVCGIFIIAALGQGFAIIACPVDWQCAACCLALAYPPSVRSCSWRFLLLEAIFYGIWLGVSLSFDIRLNCKPSMPHQSIFVSFVLIYFLF